MRSQSALPGDISPGKDALGPARLDWVSVIQCVACTLGALGAWAIAAFLVMAGLLQRYSSTGQPFDEVPLLMLAAGMAVNGLLLIISAGYAFLRLSGNRTVPMPAWLTRFPPALLPLVFILVLLAGYWVSQISALAWIFLPGLHILAVGLPVGWIAYLGIRGLPKGSRQRVWGLVSTGAVISPGIILIVEVVVLFLVIMILAFFLSNQTVLVEELGSIIQNLDFEPGSQEELLQFIGPFIDQPLVMYGILVLGAVIIPLIEELLKPIGLWLIAGKKLSPAEGLTAGVLSGCGYALFESMLLGSQIESWAGITLARVGTAAVHICTTALLGWALVSAWNQGRYLRLGIAYALAVSIHGLWNGLTLVNGFLPLAMNYGEVLGSTFLGRLAPVAPFALIVLGFGALVVLIQMNRSLQPGELSGRQPGADIV